MSDSNASPYLQKHILVCNGESCGPQGGEAVRDALKKELRARDVRKLYRDGQCSCMGLCRDGVNAVIWPEGTYLAGLQVGDIPRLIDYLQGKGAALNDLEARAAEKIKIKKGG
jgi:NADH:ubiquinone oxidoreductase subunit E